IFRSKKGAAFVEFSFNVTVPAGSRVILMHFASQNVDPTVAAASADHLVRLAGSTLAGVSAAEQQAVLNFVAADADHDGLSDDRERALGTDPNNPDTDGDGLTDGFEVAHGFNPLAPGDGTADPDGDGLDNRAEQAAGTDPRSADTDGDGRSDRSELTVDGTSPRSPDTDGDGLSDGDEIGRGTDPRKADTDGDGLSDADEVARGTNPLNPDTDGDGLADGVEVSAGLDPRDPDDAAADFDGDGLTNAEEVALGTNILNPDTDADGLTDGEEVRTFGTNPRVRDTDGGGRSDGEEVVVDHTDPKNARDDKRPRSLPVVITDGGGFQWPISGGGRIGGRFGALFGSAFDDGLGLTIDGDPFPFLSEGAPDSASGALVGMEIGPARVAGLRVRRKVFVPPDDAFIRYVEILENTGAAPLTASVSIDSDLASEEATELVGTSSGNQVFDVRDDWIVTDD